jgi:threonine/homoserine/homoserine lactone efflux protein
VTYSSDLIVIAGVVLLGCISPGANFLVVTSRALTVSRRAGLLAGAGVALASLTWASLTLAGLALVLQHAAWLLTALRLAGAAYLIHVGVRTILGARQPVPAQGAAGPGTPPWRDLWSGFLTSMSNPKAAAFFASLFVVTLPVGAPPWLYGMTLAIVVTVSAIWHCGLALAFSLGPVQRAYRRSKTTVSIVVGGLLIALGLRLLVAR